MTPESLIFCEQLAAIKSISDLESVEILVGRLMSCLRSEYLNSDLSCWQSVLLRVDEMKQQLKSPRRSNSLPCAPVVPTRDEKTDLPNVKGEVKRAIKATFAHLCTTLTRDKCLPLLAVKGESSGDKGRFCHAFNPYLWRASKVYFISICTPIKGVVKYVWDSGQRCDKSAVKLCLWLKSKACEKCRQMCLSLRSNVWQSCRQMRLRFKSKV